MKKIYLVCAAIVCMTFVMQAADWYPTTRIKVAPDAGGIPPNAPSNGALVDAIRGLKEGETELVPAGGSAIYELQRGGVYYLNAQCSLGSNDVIICAEEGTGPRPIIVPYGNSAGSDLFRSAAKLRLENLYLYGIEFGSGVARAGMIRFTAAEDAGISEFENCCFDGGAGSSILRYNDLNASYTYLLFINVNNCTFRNCIDYDATGDARGIDFRNSKNINAEITNSTFYSISAQPVRQGTNTIDNLVFVNNTIYGSTTSFPIGVAEQAVIKNNIFYNMVLNGGNSEPVAIISVDRIEYPREILFQNNLFYNEPAFEALSPATPPRYHATNILNGAGYSLIGTGELTVSDTLSYAIDFKNPPETALAYYTFQWANNFPTAIPAEERTLTRREVAIAAPAYNAGFVGDALETVEPYSFSYPDSSPAATAGEGGTYLGAWEPYEATGIPQIKANDDIRCYFDAGAKTMNITFNSAVALAKVAVYTPAGALVAHQLVVPDGQKAEYVLPELSKGAYLFVVEVPDGNRARGKFVY